MVGGWVSSVSKRRVLRTWALHFLRERTKANIKWEFTLKFEDNYFDKPAKSSIPECITTATIDGVEQKTPEESALCLHKD